MANPVDFAFLDAQTFGEDDLKREVLELFLTQAARIVPSLPGLTSREQGDAAHLLKGSARGIGAWRAAALAQDYEDAGTEARPAAFAALASAFESAKDAILSHLGAASL